MLKEILFGTIITIDALVGSQMPKIPIWPETKIIDCGPCKEEMILKTYELEKDKCAYEAFRASEDNPIAMYFYNGLLLEDLDVDGKIDKAYFSDRMNVCDYAKVRI